MNDSALTIVGAGLAGPLLACYLARAGRRIDLYERRPDPRAAGQSEGRSINLALSTRGLHALAGVGLADAVVKSAVLMRGRMMHSREGKLTFQPYGKDDTEALHSVSRAGLNRTLIDAADRHEGVRLFFNKRCVGGDLDVGILEFEDETGNGERVAAPVTLAADGAFSAVRAQMQRRERFNYQQDFLEHGYKELTIPAGPDGSFRMEPHALHIWPRGGFMMIALPNPDGSFTCTLFWPYEGPHGFAALKTREEVLRYFEEQFPDAVPLMPTLAEDFLRNPTSSLVTIRCQPWHLGGRVALVGDACHAVVPFLGQGMNAAFEDCIVVADCLARHGADYEAAFREYEARRKPHTDTLADLCIVNFIEMRDRVGSPLFVWRKRLDVLLHRLLGRWYLPLYTMIEFTRIPYADALRRSRVQAWVLRGVGLLILLAAALGVWLLGT